MAVVVGAGNVVLVVGGRAVVVGAGTDGGGRVLGTVGCVVVGVDGGTVVDRAVVGGEEVTGVIGGRGTADVVGGGDVVTSRPAVVGDVVTIGSTTGPSAPGRSGASTSRTTLPGTTHVPARGDCDRTIRPSVASLGNCGASPTSARIRRASSTALNTTSGTCTSHGPARSTATHVAAPGSTAAVAANDPAATIARASAATMASWRARRAMDRRRPVIMRDRWPSDPRRYTRDDVPPVAPVRVPDASLAGSVTAMGAGVERVLGGLWSIPVPIPDNPLGHTLVYLFETPRGPVLIDAGWDEEVSWEALLGGFAAAGLSVTDTYGVLVTHVHPDHHGLSARIRDASGAWIALHERDASMIAKLSTDPSADTNGKRAEEAAADFRDELAALLLDAGASEQELHATTRPSKQRARKRPLAQPDRFLQDGDRMDVPGWAVDAVWTPGHSPGHTCFRVPDHGLLLAGDHVLPGITPHIAISRADRHGDPLADFLESLRKVDQPDVTLVLPAHEHSFTHLHERVEEITRHHHDHLAEIELILAAGPASLWEIAGRLVWNRPWDDLSLAMKRAAVNETAAHLRYLSRRERAVRFKGVKPITFGLPTSAAAANV